MKVEVSWLVSAAQGQLCSGSVCLIQTHPWDNLCRNMMTDFLEGKFLFFASDLALFDQGKVLRLFFVVFFVYKEFIHA